MAGENKRCDKNIRRLMTLASEMIALADRGDAQREDVGCGILFGIVRDCAYKIRSLAQSELLAHQGVCLPEQTSYEPSCAEKREKSEFEQPH